MMTATEEAILTIIGHLGAAQMQRAPSDDRIIAEHIDAALKIAMSLRRIDGAASYSERKADTLRAARAAAAVAQRVAS